MKHGERVSYSTDAFTDFRLAEKIAKALEKNGIEFDAFLCQGISGIIPAARASLVMEKGLTVVRKEKELDTSHAYHLVEGDFVDSYVFVDDFVNDGITFNRVKTAIEKEHGLMFLKPPEIKAVVLYQHPRGCSYCLAFAQAKSFPTIFIREGENK